MKVLLLSRYDTLGASSRVRAYQYFPFLESRGIEVLPAPLLGNEYLKTLYSRGRRDAVSVLRGYWSRAVRLARRERFDLIWIEYELFPWLPYWLERLAIPASVPYVVEFDDAIFHRYDLHPRGIVRKLLGRQIDSVMRRAAAVIAGNEYIAARARQSGSRRVEILPSVVDTARYPVLNPPPEEPFTLGWIGTPKTVGSLRKIVPALADLHGGGPTRIVLIGSGAVDLGCRGVSVLPWSAEAEAAEIAGFHVGLMPVTDEPWSRGKCGYKLVQYMAAARPVVASPVGANTEIVEHGMTGFLAGTLAEWKTALERLRQDPALRARMGQAGRLRVEERYALAVTAPRLAALLHEAAAADR